MENWYLPPARQKPLRRGEGPILHDKISLSVLRVSNEARLTGRMGGENGFECEPFPALVIGLKEERHENSGIDRESQKRGQY